MTYPTRISGTVLLDAVDVSAYVDPVPGVTIRNILTQKVDTCSLTLERASALSPATWQELIVMDGATRIFGGYVTSIGDQEGADLDLDYKISASDFSIRFGKVIVKEEFTNQSDAEILDALFTEYLPGEGFNATTYVNEVKTHASIRFNRMTLLDVIKKLANLAKADFYVDYNKNLHFFEADTSTADAPFSLSTSPDESASMPYNNLQVNHDGSDIVNRVEIVGGNYLSDDATFYLQGTGEDNRISLPFRFRAPEGETSIVIHRNDGTQGTPSWTELTVKAGYIEQIENTTDVLYYYQEKVIEQQNNFPNLPNAVRITAKYEVPLRTRVKDQASIDFYGLIFDGLIVDNTITDKPTARLAGLAELARNAMEKTSVSLETREPGLQAGQVVTLVNSIHSINTQFLIQSVTVKVGIYGKATYSISLGTYNHDLIDLIINLARITREDKTWRDDEVLDELLQTAEALTLAEADTVEDTTGPYYFSNTLEDAFIWGFGVLANTWP